MDGNIFIRHNSQLKGGKYEMNTGILVTPIGEYRREPCLDPSFLVYINDLKTDVPLYKYVVDSTLFEVCDKKGVSVIQESVDIAAR